MSQIPREIIDEIIHRNDIEQVVGAYVTLKRAGSNFNGLCPFHNEKTPSFTVFPATKSFYCFGCGAGGDAITFVMRTENLDYRAAIEVLAQRAGITIPEDDSHTEDTVPRKRIYEMNLAAAKFFRNCLFDDKYGKEALAYLHEERKLSMATIKQEIQTMNLKNDNNSLRYSLFQMELKTREMREKFLQNKKVNVF